MPTTADGLKTWFHKRANEAIEHLIEQEEDRQDLSMSQMKDLVREFEVEVRQAMMQELVAEGHVKVVGENCAIRSRSADRW